MKKLISSLLLLLFVSNVALADCDFKTGITPGPNNTYIYTEACHLKVGQLVQTNANLTQANKDLTAAIQLKDLALTASDNRANMWLTTAQNEQDRLAKMSSDAKLDSWLWFGLGILTTSLTAYTASKLSGH